MAHFNASSAWPCHTQLGQIDLVNILVMNVLMFLTFEHKIKGLCFFQEKLEMLRIENMYAHGFHIQHTQHPHAY